MHVTARQEPLEQEAEQLKRHILEGECRPVEQLQQPVAMVKLHQRRDTRMVEPAIGLGAQVAKLVLAQRIADERGHHGNRRFHIACGAQRPRSEEHTSELQSLMSISYAVFCLKQK